MTTTTTPTFLVVGVAGDVGAAAATSLLARGVRVRALIHRTAPRLPGLELVHGDLADPAALATALDGVTGAVLVTPHHPDEAALGDGFVAAAEAAGVRRLVFSAAARPMSRLAPLDALLDRATGLLFPHYRAKLAVARRVRRARLAGTVLLPSNFFQNDEPGLAEILAGRYPHPLGHRPMNRVDTRDIGDAAARALLDDDVAPGLYPLVGPEDLTGPASAAVWADALGTAVTYGGDDLDAWRATIGARMTPAKAADFAKTYRVIQRLGFRPPRWMHARTARLLGRAPRRYADYVRDTAARGIVAPACSASWTSATDASSSTTGPSTSPPRPRA